MKKEYFNEKNGLHYKLAEDGFYYPVLGEDDEKVYHIGKYGRMRKRYLEEHHSAIYNYLFLSNKLQEHLCEIDVKSENMVKEIVNKMAEKENCNNTLKMKNQMQWVGLMNNYHACAEEVVLREIVYR